MPDASSSLPSPQATALRCLVASSRDDDLDLLPRLLSAMGHQFDTARTAEALLNSVFDQPRDVLLLDLALLAPDPAQYVEAIRQHTSTQGQTVRLIALADASGARRADLDIGFDAVLLRPIETAKLETTLSTRLAAPTPDGGVPVDLATLRLDLDGDESLLRHLATVLINDFPRTLQTLQSALASRDASQFARTIHNLRGALGNFRAGPAFIVANDLERLAAEGRLDAAQEHLPMLVEELKKLEKFFLELGASRA